MALRGFLGIDDRIVRLVDQQNVHNALVLVENCREFQCYGSVFSRNTPGLDGDVVYAKDIVSERPAIIAAFPGRKVYIAKYSRPSLQAYDPATLPPATGGLASPTATVPGQPSP